MRILFISQLFDPEYSIKGLTLMQRLVAEGHEVVVLTTFPNYPTGKVYDGHSVKFKQVEEIGGVKIVRLWSHISHSKSKVSRAWSYMSFTIMALFTALFIRKPDIVYAYHPQSTTGMIGVLMKTLRRVPFITDVQDLWPDALIATGAWKDGLLLSLISRWSNFVYRQASQVVVLSEGFRNTLISRGVSSEKVKVVYNWCPEEKSIESALSPKYELRDVTLPAKFVYAGNLGTAQALSTMISALGGFQESELSFTLIGGGVEKKSLEQYVLERGFKNVFFRDYVSSSKIFNVLADADVLVIHLKDDELFKITIPSKTQSSMAMGKPILMAVGGEANQLVIEGRAGEVADPEDEEGIREATRRLLLVRDKWSELGDNAREYYTQKLSMSVNFEKLLDVINSAIESR